MEIGVVVLLAAFVVTFAAVKALEPVAHYVGLLDKPGGRKKHVGAVPLIGGLAIFAGVFLVSYVFLEQPLFIRFFMLAGGLIVFMGMLDDRYELSARFRLAAQFLVACIFVYGLDVKIETFGNLFGFGEVHLGWLGYPLTILSLIGVLNAVNMLDGMDGLVGSLALISFSGLAYLFASSGDVNLFLLCLVFVGAICAFLVFNLKGSPTSKIRKIFMGDAGSMFVGLSVGVFLVAGSQGAEVAFKPITALWFVLLPMTDMFTLMYRRLKRGKSPFDPDRTHIHHILMRAGFSPIQVLSLVIVTQFCLVFLGILIDYLGYGELASFSAALIFVISYQLLMKRSWRFIRWSKRRVLLFK